MSAGNGRDDTIFALASAPGRAGVAVVRVSGPAADQVLMDLTGRPLFSERTAVLCNIFDSPNGDRIDQALVLRFCPPHSYTGENIVEFQIHGGRAIVAALWAALAARPGLRLAEAGEFTRRAVENGRLDLTRAEAIADLVDAETEMQRRQAMRQFGGTLDRLYEDWRTRLIRAAAWVEAALDFPDEDIPPDALAQSRAALAGLETEMRRHLDDGRRGEILREGLHVAVIGPPNAGKSALVNALAQRDVAIVSEIAGTTRDVIEVRLDLEGYPVILADTAGLRATEDSIEREGVRRARARAETADVRLLVLDASVLAPPMADFPAAELVVWNKADLVAAREPGLWISARTGEGMNLLIARLSAYAAEKAGQGEAPVPTRARHRASISDAVEALEAAGASTEPELTAEHLRRALHAVGRLTGRVDLDELLDVVFRDFCIGK